jgi:hypothetical protein
MVADWAEQIGDYAPASAGFGPNGGRATLPLFFTSLSEDRLKDLLGYVIPDGSGKLNRSLPAGHPVWWWMTAESVSNIQGIGKPEMVAFNPGIVKPQGINIAYYASYPVYLWHVDFLQKPYEILPNSKIKVTSVNWTDKGNAASPTTDRKLTTEYKRWTSWEFLPDADLITAQFGTQVFRATGTVNTRTFTGMPRLLIPKGVLKVTWWQVPEVVIDHDNSFILKYLGRVNLTDFQLKRRAWTAGELRYRSVEVKRYLPYLPDTVIDTSGKPLNLLGRWCDISFYFEYTRRPNADPPSPGPTDGNIVYNQGHNCMPYIDRKFYYVSGNTPGQEPTWDAFPFQLLWTDPSA